MSSEVEGQPTAGVGRRGDPTSGPGLRFRLAFGRLLRRPFRSVFAHQARVNRQLIDATEEAHGRLVRLERDVRQDNGDLAGALLGQLAELQRVVHTLEHRIGRLEEQLGPAPVPGPDGPAVSASERAPVRPGPRLRQAGVNLVGDLTATTGLAQAARRLAAGLTRRGVPLVVTELRSGAPQIEDLLPPELRDPPGGRNPQVDLVTLNINELSDLAEDELGRAHTGRYAIATWYWEFETLPPDLVSQVDRVDEIWAPSEFVRRTFQRYTDAPVHVVPAIVPVFPVGAPPAEVRHQWGKAGDEVVFLFTFDFNSSVLRKNPFGVIDAYRQAFGAHPPATGLVIKAINLSVSPAFADDLRAAVASVDGVLIDEHLPVGELGDLFHACDVYVSLHRSEGFGLGMAEAMALGKAVVGTAYSGNVDFMDGGNSCLVGYRLRPVVTEDHRYSGAVGTVYRPGLLCAEPDVDQAARWMRLLAEDAGLRRRLGAAAAAAMAGRFTDAAVVDAAVTRLNVLMETGNT